MYLGSSKSGLFYDPYGAAITLNASFAVGYDSYAWQYRDQGLRYESITNTQDNRNRIYFISLGRFGQVDPKGYPDGASRYQREVGNPISKVDPLGWAPAPLPEPIVITVEVDVDHLSPFPITTKITGTLENGVPTVGSYIKNEGQYLDIADGHGAHAEHHVWVTVQQGLRGKWEPFGPPRSDVHYEQMGGTCWKVTNTFQDFERDDAVRTIAIDIIVRGQVDDTTWSHIDTTFNFSIGPFISPTWAITQAALETAYSDMLSKLKLNGEVHVTKSNWRLTAPARKSQLLKTSKEVTKCPDALFRWKDDKLRTIRESAK